MYIINNGDKIPPYLLLLLLLLLIKPLSVNDLNKLYEDIASALRNCSDPYLHK